MTSHPIDMSDTLDLLYMANNSKIMPFLHLPIQSGLMKFKKNEQENIQLMNILK